MNSSFDHKWLIKLPPFNDEIFSSWLTRLAMTYGCNSLDITWAFWGKWRAWMTDIDRGVNGERFKDIVGTGVIEEGKLHDLFLDAPAKKIGKTINTSIWPWILSIGSRNRKRIGGIQYCPICLDEEPYYKLSWRYAWHTCCYKHSLRLSQRCPNCLSSIEYHRLTAEDKHLYICPSCKFDLRETKSIAVTSNQTEVQKACDRVLEKGFGTYGSLRLKTQEWFSVYKFYLRFLQKCKDKRMKGLRGLAAELGIDNIYPSSTGLALEMLSVKDRVEMFNQSYPLMVSGPQKINRQLKSYGISLQTCLSIMDPLPDKIRSMFRLDVKKKPYNLGVRAKYLPSSKRSVLKANERLMRGLRKSG